MSFTIDETLETLDNFREEFYELLRTEFYRGTVRTLNATRLFFSTSYLTKFESTPAEVVVAKKRFSLSRFWTEHRSSTYNPILLIPPLMVTPQIYDLRPRHSFVRYLLERGFDVFLIDFGSPKRKDREIRLDDYVNNICQVLDFIKEATTTDQVNLVGYCMGGIFSNIVTALDEKKSVRNVVSIGSPADFSQLPKYYALAQHLDRPLIKLADLCDGIPASVSRSIFQMMQPIKNLTLPINFVWNLWDEDYIAAHESMERWFDNFVGYPRDAFKQFFTEIVRDNKLFNGQLRINNRRVDLKKIEVPYLVVAGKEDFIGHPQCVRPIVNAINSKDKTYHEVVGGHLGIIAGKTAPTMWRMVSEWLIERSRSKKRVKKVFPKTLTINKRSS